MAKPSRFALAVQEVMRRAIDPELSPLGFKKSHATYRRIAGPCVQIVNVQSSAFQVLDARFTMNVGLDFPAAHEVGVGLLRSSGPGWYGLVSVRVGALMPAPDGKWYDRWWEVAPLGPAGGWRGVRPADDPFPSTSTVVAEVREVIRNAVLPWLTKYSDPKALLRDYGEGRSGMVIAMMLGDRSRARRMAAKYLRSAPNDDLAREWARKLGPLPRSRSRPLARKFVKQAGRAGRNESSAPRATAAPRRRGAC